MIKIVYQILAKAAWLFCLQFRPTRSVQAENLFLRRQLALFKERDVQPRRVDVATRISLAVRLFDWAMRWLPFQPPGCQAAGAFLVVSCGWRISITEAFGLEKGRRKFDRQPSLEASDMLIPEGEVFPSGNSFEAFMPAPAAYWRVSLDRCDLPGSPIIYKNIAFLSCFAYDWEMPSLDAFLDKQLARGRAYFTRGEALDVLSLVPDTLTAAISRLIKKRRLANPRHGFYLILRPEDQLSGAPDPVRWIDPLMKYQAIDYRISLLRAAAFHGSSHQAAMVFQVIVPKQLRGFEMGRHRLQFVYQAPRVFAKANQSEGLAQIKSEAGYAKVAGVEITLLDCARYLHRAAGINGVAQIVKDLGPKANSRKLAELALAYENASVRRLGYLLDLAGHSRQAKALEPFAGKAKSVKALDPSIKSFIGTLAMPQVKNQKWMLLINEHVEIDS